MTETTSIPLNKLVTWQGNVRKTAGADTALAELAASIAAHGLLQSLVVRKHKGGKYAVVAGARRLAALNNLAEAGKVAADHTVPCQVIAADADAAEISLAENTVREQMHPADEFEAFRELIDRGTPVPDIAARFGVTDMVVRQRLKLARVSPVIVRAYRDGNTTLACVMAFAVTDDHEAQEQLWNSAPEWVRTRPDGIRDHLTDHEITSGDRRVKFVTLKAYEKAGGAVRRDLFSEGTNGIFIGDVALLDRLVAAKLEKAARTVASEGWKWVETRSAFDHADWSGCDRLDPELAPLPAKLASELAALEAEFTQLDDAWNANEDEDAAYPERMNEIGERIDELNNGREDLWTADQLAIAGAVIFLGHDGKAETRRGYVLPADQTEIPAAPEASNGDDGSVCNAGDSAGLSAALIENLTLHRTAAISAELLNRPDIALAALVHTLAAQVFLGSASGNTCLEVFTTSKSLRNVEGAKAFDAMTSAGENWGNQIPGTRDALWKWCLEQDQQVLLDLLAFCMARSVNAVRTKKDSPDDPRFAHADRLAATLKLDMTAWFTPNAENYFAKISKTGILEALREAKGDIAPAWNKAKKGELAAIAERQLPGTGWLPELLRMAA
jgi:ParB family chromosome partitioning protein